MTTTRAELVEPVPPERRPGPGVHLTEDERHAWHHYRVAADKYAYDLLVREKARGGIIRHQRREAEKRAVWNLKSHLSGMHGRGQGRFPVDATYAQMAARHDALHGEAAG